MESIVSMTGRLGTEVDSRISRNGKHYANFRLAHAPRFRRADGAWEDGPTNWVTVKCWGNLATHVDMSLRKGHPVVVVGKLRVEEWTTEHGVMRQQTTIEALSVGHDLSWCVSRYSKLERERVEPDPVALENEPEEDLGAEEDLMPDEVTIEQMMEEYAEPVA